MSTESEKPFLSFWWSLYALLVLGFPIYFLVNYIDPPEDYGAIPPFQLQTQSAESFDLETINRPIVVNFIFTRCPNICPTLTAKMATLQERIPADEALLLSITVDPQHDVPAVLQEYADRFSADSSRWFFVTGEEKNIRAIVRTFQQTYERMEDSEQTPNILHSEKFILLDKDAHIRGFFDDDPKGLNLLMRTISAL